MKTIKIHVLRMGEVRVSPYLPFGGDDCSLLKVSGWPTTIPTCNPISLNYDAA